ncbi:MAG TPA: glycosyltransferase family 39 protein [Candidatus Saccharimonadales bacterium]|nr:glycosyltransferase family 39 protein [Candidatus Saccharimonadales bacterium]
MTLVRTYAILWVKLMNIRPVSEWTSYKYRFWVAYLLLAALVGLSITLYSTLVPPGLGPSERQSIISSATIVFTEMPTAIVDLPYHILQKFSVEFLGVTPFGVRLPSMIIGSLTAIFVLLILRRWMPNNIAIIAGIIVLTSGWFIGVSRLGAPFIMIPFWSSLILLAATYISQQTPHWKGWKVVMAFAAALSLYTPFSIYLFLAAIIAAIAQPHLRYLIRQSSSFHLTVGTLLFLLVLAPLGWGLYKDPSQAWSLLAIPAQLPDPLQFLKDLFHALSGLVNPFNVSFGEFMTPLISVVSAFLLGIGVLRLLRDFHAVRAYVLLIWGAVLIPIIGLNPNNLMILMVPIMLGLAIGLQPILRYWYKLFPLNPYARVFGLIPLTLLVLALVQFNDQRYTFGMIYSEGAKKTFSTDAFLAQNTLNKLDPASPTTVVVTENELPLYRLVAKDRPNTVVTSPAQAVLGPGTWVVAEDQLATMTAPPAPQASEVVVNDNKDNALRFRVFQR